MSSRKSGGGKEAIAGKEGICVIRRLLTPAKRKCCILHFADRASRCGDGGVTFYVGNIPRSANGGHDVAKPHKIANMKVLKHSNQKTSPWDCPFRLTLSELWFREIGETFKSPQVL